MKHIFIILSFLVLLIGCTPNTKSESEVNAEKIIPTSGSNIVNRVYEFEYKGHSYIIFRQGTGDFSTAGVVHNPECNCLKNK